MGSNQDITFNFLLKTLPLTKTKKLDRKKMNTKLSFAFTKIYPNQFERSKVFWKIVWERKPAVIN